MFYAGGRPMGRPFIWWIVAGAGRWCGRGPTGCAPAAPGRSDHDDCKRHCVWYERDARARESNHQRASIYYRQRTAVAGSTFNVRSVPPHGSSGEQGLRGYLSGNGWRGKLSEEMKYGFLGAVVRWDRFRSFPGQRNRGDVCHHQQGTWAEQRAALPGSSRVTGFSAELGSQSPHPVAKDATRRGHRCSAYFFAPGFQVLFHHRHELIGYCAVDQAVVVAERQVHD
jgi:hypothetical protein